MHVCQILLIEADTVEEAFDEVRSRLNDANEWWDYYSEAGQAYNLSGRWTGEIFSTKPKVEDENEFPNYLQYSADPDLAEKVIQEFVEARMVEIEFLRKKIVETSSKVDIMTFDYNPIKPTGLAMEFYYTKKLTNLLMNTWAIDTGVYDLQVWTASLDWFMTRVQVAPEKQWLIPVDFHA